jgi:dihydroflavonol-4-reductase
MSGARRVFVTGGSGLLGGALVGRLLADGADVVALARSDASAAALAQRGATVARADLLDEAGLTRAMAGCELVYHVAGVNTLCPDDPSVLHRINGEAPAIVVRAAKAAGVGRLVNTSSAAVLGEAEGTVGHEESTHRGTFMSTYEESKLAGERAAFAAGAEAGLEVVSVNPSSVQGPGRSGGTGKILLAVLDGRLKVFIDTHISVVDMADCIEAHLLAAERGQPGRRYVVSGATLTSAEALDLLSRVGGVPVRPRIVPKPVAQAGAAAVEGAFRLARRHPPLCREMMRTLLHGHRYDGSRAERELGLRYTPVEDTLRRTLDWAIAEGHVRDRRPAA